MLEPTWIQKPLGEVNLHLPTLEQGRRHVLHVVHRVPYPPDKGDRIRAFHTLRFLARHANVHLACLADEPIDEESLMVLRRYCHRLAVVPLGRSRWLRALASLVRGRTVSEGAFRSPALASILRKWTADTSFSAAVASSSAVAPYLRLPPLSSIPAIIDLVDVDSQKWFDYAADGRGWRAWLYRTEGCRLRKLEQHMPTWAHAVTLVSEAEARLYRQFCSPGCVRAIGNGVDLDFFQPNRVAEELACVFVGALDYRPNIDAVCWFAQEIWPGVHHRVPGCKLWLVGRRPTAAVRELAGRPGIEVIGQVPDVRPWLSRASAVIAPLRIARGLQNKVLEALAMGKAVIASPPALAALNVTPGKHCLRAATPAQWTKAVTRLLRDEPHRGRLGAAGRQFVEAHHHWDRCLEPLNELLDMPVSTSRHSSAKERRDPA